MFIFVCLFITNFSLAENFTFETSKIRLIEDGNVVLATDGRAMSYDDDLEIVAKRFEYNKTQKLLKAFNGTAYFKKKI